MTRSWLCAMAVALCLTASIACGPGVDLSKSLRVTDVLGGYYDAGVKDGKNYLLPSISFRLHNQIDRKIGPVQLTVAFWMDGADGEWDSLVLQGIRGQGLQPGATTESLLARGNVGYTLEGSRADFFAHSGFRDITAKLFASQAGSIVRIGEFKLERTIIPQMK